VQELEPFGEEHVETRRIESADDAPFGEHRAVGAAGIDLEELLAQHALGGHVEDRVVADGLLVALLDRDLHAHERLALVGHGVDLSAAVLDLVDLADLHAGDAHRRARTDAAGVVEVDEDGELRLEAHLAHHEHERREEPQGHENEQAHFDLDGALLHDDLSYLISAPGSRF
jgi:hypothetical protein